nr:MAG TPA: hypothetical protein [Crassvirales sp.]
MTINNVNRFGGGGKQEPPPSLVELVALSC